MNLDRAKISIKLHKTIQFLSKTFDYFFIILQNLKTFIKNNNSILNQLHDLFTQTLMKNIKIFIISLREKFVIINLRLYAHRRQIGFDFNLSAVGEAIAQ